jgi:hypothetical protein
MARVPRWREGGRVPPLKTENLRKGQADRIIAGIGKIKA